MKNKIMTTVILVCGITVSSVSLAEAMWLDKVIVQVEEDVILDSELKRRMKTITHQLQTSNNEIPPEDAIKKQVLEQLIMEQIQLQMANRAGVRVSDAELTTALERIADENKISVSQMKDNIEKDRMSYSLFREDIRNKIIISRVRQGFVSQKIFISDQEIDDILVLMENQGASTIQYHLRHLMLALSESASPSEEDNVRTRITDIQERFTNGENFSQLIIAESDGSDALEGGDLGWRTIGQLPKLFAGSINNLEPGQLSEPIRSANGFHLLKLEDKKGGLDKQMIDEIHLRHILIKVSKITTEAKAEAMLLQIRKDIIAGETSFEEQAKVISEDLGTASLGGDLGWAQPRAFLSLYGDKVNDLVEGEPSFPIKGGEGWYLVEKLGSRTTDQTEEVKRMRAHQILQQRKYDEEQESWLREIREQAYVKILDEEE
ncbi:MAG: molecular chaperone SurA [Gammaproteobacteria bacterium]|nr:molecular chaperone SurA [Gammaproteobacteria bacterium]